MNKNTKTNIIVFLIALPAFYFGFKYINGDYDPIPGCMDEFAYNYNKEATVDDGSCIDVIKGCLDKNAFNYNSEANTDDGTCCFVEGCMDPKAENFNNEACIENKTCYYGILEGSWEGSEYVAGVKFNSKFKTTRDGTYTIQFGMDNSWTNIFDCNGEYELIRKDRIKFYPRYSEDGTKTKWEAELKSQSIFFYNEDNDYFIWIPPTEYHRD